MATISQIGYVTRIPGGSQYTITQCRVETRTKSALIKTPEHALLRTRPGIFVPPTPFSASHVLTQKMRGGFLAKTGSGETGYRNSITLRNLTFASTTSIEIKAINKALASLKDQKINLAQSFAERKQAANLVADSATRIFTAFKAVRKGDLERAKRALGLNSRKGTARTWLEFQYGWKPLLNDVYGACETLRKHDSAEPFRYRADVRGFAKDRNTQNYDINPSGDMRETGLDKWNIGCKIHLTYKLDNPALASLANVGILNPALLAWELLPFSFVADWFIPVGSYLNTFDASLGYSFMGGSKTVRRETEITNTRQVRTGSVLGSLVYWEYSRGRRYSKTVTRSVYSTEPSGRFPGFKNPLSLQHMLNAIALLQGIKGLK